MQLRMSPGGRILYSRRRRPELPPSSITVTTAAKSDMGRFDCFFFSATYSFSPRSTVERPVPPPSATILTGRARGCAISFTEERRMLSGRAVSLRIEQFRKARIFLQEREVLVVPRVVAVFRTQLNRELQIVHRGLGFAGQAIERGHGIDDVVRFRSRFARAVQMFARFIPAP